MNNTFSNLTNSNTIKLKEVTKDNSLKTMETAYYKRIGYRSKNFNSFKNHLLKLLGHMEDAYLHGMSQRAIGAMA